MAAVKGEPTQAPADTAGVDLSEVDRARAAFVAGLIHGTLSNGGWTVHEADATTARCTVGLAALFGPGFVGDVTVTIRQVDQL